MLKTHYFTNSRYIFKLFGHLNMFIQNYTASLLHIMTSSQRTAYGKEGKRRVVTLQWRNQHYLTQMITVNTNSHKSCWQLCTLDVMWWKWHLTSVILLLKPIIPVQSEGKQNPVERHSTKYLTSTPKWSGSPKTRKVSPEEPRETWQLNVM